MTLCKTFTLQQRAAFHAVGIGLGLCIVACVSPYWFSGKVISLESSLYSTHQANANDHELDIHVGLWWYCLSGNDKAEDKCVYLYSPKTSQRDLLTSGLPQMDDDPVFLFLVRSVMVMCLLTSLVGLLLVCFYCSTCCTNGKSLGFGISFFIAGALGYAVLFIVTLKIDVLLDIPIYHAKNGWAYPLFLTGNTILFAASIILCLPIPEQHERQYELIYYVKSPHPTSPFHLSGKESTLKPLPCPETLISHKTLL